MKGAVTKVIDTLTQEDFKGVFQKILEWYNKCIATRGDTYLMILVIVLNKTKLLYFYDQS